MLTQLKIFRLSKGIKLIDVARDSKLSVSFLSRIENGKLKGTKETQRKIAKALGTSQENLFGRN